MTFPKTGKISKNIRVNAENAPFCVDKPARLCYIYTEYDRSVTERAKKEKKES